jgi:hypothetical protein
MHQVQETPKNADQATGGRFFWDGGAKFVFTEHPRARTRSFSLSRYSGRGQG